MTLTPFKGRTLDVGKPVRVYRNLRGQGGRWSIRQGSLVVAHANEVALTDVRFLVLPGGLAEMRRRGQKTVCAFAEGWVDGGAGEVADLPQKVLFNPAAGRFEIENWTIPLQRVDAAGRAAFTRSGCTVAEVTPKET